MKYRVKEAQLVAPIAPINGVTVKNAILVDAPVPSLIVIGTVGEHKGKRRRVPMSHVAWFELDTATAEDEPDVEVVTQKVREVAKQVAKPDVTLPNRGRRG